METTQWQLPLDSGKRVDVTLQGVSSDRALSRLIRKSLNVLLASSKIAVDDLGISTEGFGRGCGESDIKVGLGVAQALISITLASTKLRNSLALSLLVTV